MIFRNGSQSVWPLEEVPNLGQREADKLQRHDLLQAHQVAIGVEAIAGGRASAGLEQAQAIIVVQCPDGDSGALGKFVRLISSAHPRPSLLNTV